MGPQSGDILVSSLSARTDHEVSIVPAPATLVLPTYKMAVAKAQELARQGHVDLWLTEDHTHFLKLESYRE